MSNTSEVASTPSGITISIGWIACPASFTRLSIDRLPPCSACLGHPLARFPLAIGRQVIDLLALRLAALSAFLRVLRPGAAVTAPALARIEPLRHLGTSIGL
jgi:hypothetical protein